MSKYDAIIIGGGPAGAAAAYLLATAGMRTLLAEKKVFPRDKLCGGLLSGRSRTLLTAIFGESYLPPLEYTASGIKLFHQQRLIQQLPASQPLDFTARYDFDASLITCARRAGAVIQDGVAVRGVNFVNNTVSFADGTTRRADFIVGADGVYSRVAQGLFRQAFPAHQLALGLEIAIPRECLADACTQPEIYFGVARWGYGWVFPNKQTVLVGLGGLSRLNPAFPQIFKTFLRDRFGNLPTPPIKGHYLPFGQYRRAPGRGATLLVGDAASLVDPITGEGIALALQSGQCAASAILQAAAAQNPATALQAYLPQYRQITRELDQANLMRWLLFPKRAEHLFVKIISKSARPLEKHLALLHGDITYKEYRDFILTRLGRYVVKTILRCS